MATEKKSGESILRIRVRAYENKVLDASVKQIIETAHRHDAVLRGPVPLPNEIKKYSNLKIFWAKYSKKFLS